MIGYGDTNGGFAVLVAHAIQSRLADDPLNDIADAPMTAPADATHPAW